MEKILAIFWPSIKDEKTAQEACLRSMAAISVLFLNSIIAVILFLIYGPGTGFSSLQHHSTIFIMLIPFVVFCVVGFSIYYLIKDKSMLAAQVILFLCLLNFPNGLWPLNGIALILSIGGIRGALYFRDNRKKPGL